jgi:maleate isomerase
MPVADAEVRRFFTDCGFEVVRLLGLKCASPVLIAHVSERELRDAILAVDGPEVEAVIQLGTNLAMARLAGIAEFWLQKPVLAINTATYWRALRTNGIDDPVEGFGSLMASRQPPFGDTR